jgi:quercetin dioxygenase-like cupin family protein
MKISTIDRAQAGQDSSRSGYFDGEVHVQTITGPGDSDEIEMLAVFFSPGGRTRAHIHQRDQVLHILTGQGIVATETEKRVVNPGDVITIPAGVWHWHGATRDSAMCHLSIKQPGPTDWEVAAKNWASGYDE